MLAAINHREPDHVPIDVCGTDVTGINVLAYRRLLEYMGQAVEPELPILDTVQQLAEPSEEFLRMIGAHCRAIFPSPSASWKFELKGDVSHDWFFDEWGMKWRKSKSSGLYFDLDYHPLAGASLGQLSRYAWPDPADPARHAGVCEAAGRLHCEGQYAVIVSGITGGGAMELASWMAGFSNFLIALGRDPTWADALLDRILEIKLRFWQTLLPKVADYVDIVSESEDLGIQDRLMVSPRTFREHIKPRLRQLFAGIKEAAPHVKILLHSDGAIMPILPDLIEIGLDILNPVQVSAKGMGDTAFLKREFGNNLVFWGAIDTQYVLPRGTPQDVRGEVQRRIDNLAPGGGYVLASVHNIQGDVPPENILAMLQAWQEFG